MAFTGVIYLSWNNKYMDFAPDFEKQLHILNLTIYWKLHINWKTFHQWSVCTGGCQVLRWSKSGFGWVLVRVVFIPIISFTLYPDFRLTWAIIRISPESIITFNDVGRTRADRFLLFIALCFVLLMTGENVYHRCNDPKDKCIIMASTLGFIIIFAMCLINDLIETDKVGPFFFLMLLFFLFFTDKYSLHKRSSEMSTKL